MFIRSEQKWGIFISDDPFYLIRKSHLPEVIQKTVEVTELLQQDASRSVLQATSQVGISRGAYYKYKDAVRPFYAAVQGNIVTVALTLRHVTGVLSHVLNTLSSRHANILTINQSLPLQGLATVIISMETRDMTTSFDEVLDELREAPGIQNIHVVGQSEVGGGIG